MRYSQNDEEDAILAYFRGRPAARFLDIGAHDGVALSNTYALSLAGWNGVLVEPSPSPFIKLMETYRGREDSHLVHAPIVPEAGLLTMHDARGDFVSTFDNAHRELWAAPARNREGVAYQPITVAGITMGQLFAKFPGPYAFINLDVEGLNYELFAQMPPLERLGCELFCIEYQDKIKEIDALADAQNFRRFHTTSENALYVRP